MAWGQRIRWFPQSISRRATGFSCVRTNRPQSARPRRIKSLGRAGQIDAPDVLGVFQGTGAKYRVSFVLRLGSHHARPASPRYACEVRHGMILLMSLSSHKAVALRSSLVCAVAHHLDGCTGNGTAPGERRDTFCRIFEFFLESFSWRADGHCESRSADFLAMRPRSQAKKPHRDLDKR